MRTRQLIEALTEECRATPTKVEDFLRALADLAGEALEHGEELYVPALGRFRLRPYVEHSSKRTKARLSFLADPELRARLKLIEPVAMDHEPCSSCKTKNPGMCEDCKSRKRHVAVYKKCKSCIRSQTRRNRKQIGMELAGVK